MDSEKPLRSAWSDGDDSDDQKTAVSSSPSPMSILVPHNNRTSWFTSSGPGSVKNRRPVTASDFRSRRASVLSHSRSGEKMKDIPSGKDSIHSSAENSNSTSHDDPSTQTGSPIASKENSSRSSSGNRSVSSPIPKKRGSILVTATDMLSFKFGRRHKAIRQLPTPILLPDVIEISRRDDEVEERERLRDAAAQSIGLNPTLMSAEETLKEVDETESNSHEPDGAETVDGFTVVDRFTPDISDSMVSYNGSMRLPKPSIPTVPDFPVTITLLANFKQNSVHLVKYHPPSSLRLFTLSKNWKNRYLVLSSGPPRSSQGVSPSFLHLFRSSNVEERELERLEINEESVVFVAEEDVGGRKNIIKVAGVDVGSNRGTTAMWFLQIPEAQQWITLIKSVILGQRSMRAGLGIPTHTQGGIEPRGDMDVMLSMRAQGIVTSLTVGSLKQTNFNTSRSFPTNVSHPFSTSDQNCAASISSQSSRSQAPSPKPQTLAVSALKGLFSTRPRSPSRSVSFDEASERETEDSFGNMGHSLLSMSHSTGIPDVPPSPLQPSKHCSSNTEYKVPVLTSEQRLDRRIVVVEQQGASWEMPMRPARTLSVNSLSLQPAPRRRPWTIGSQTSAPVPPPVQSERDRKDSTGTTKDEPSSAVLPSNSSFSGFSFGTPEQRARAPSLRSVSTFASADNGSNMDRSSSSTKTKRWSRQGSLPKRLTPPSGPPPAVPQSPNHGVQNGHSPYLSESGTWQSSSSIPSATSQVSVISGLPTFSKRGSNSSANSGGPSSPHSLGHSISRAGSHRSIVPPPRPAPTFAPPPAPNHDIPPKPAEPIPPRSPSFRHRSFRLSLTAPKPPPLTNLPPRPDDPEYHARPSSSSSSAHTHTTDLYPIPGSPLTKISPIPPPTYPLPPTPSSTSPTTPQVSRNTSLKQRLRILSAPSSSSTPPVPENDRPPSRHRLTRAYHLPGQMYTPPATPIGEQITQYQDDPNFLQMQTPITPLVVEPRTVRRLPLLPDQSITFPGITSLSPPPRRGSRQLPLVEKGDTPPSSGDTIAPSPTPIDDKPMSLSRHGSVISLGIVSM